MSPTNTLAEMLASLDRSIATVRSTVDNATSTTDIVGVHRSLQRLEATRRRIVTLMDEVGRS